MSPLNVEHLNAYTDDCTTTTSTTSTSTTSTSTTTTTITTTTTTTTVQKTGELQIKLKTCHCNNGTKNINKPETKDVECKDKWKKFKNKCYLAVDTSNTNWSKARKNCLKLQGDLASVPDQETKKFLTGLGNKAEHWIGGQKNENGKWTWTDGTPWKNEFWAKGEPNNLKVKVGGITRNQTALVQKVNGQWDDQANDYGNRGYICQSKNNFKTPGQVKLLCTKT